MSAFQLQTIAPIPHGQTAGGKSPKHSAEIVAEREAAYRSGFLDGQAAATEAQLAEQGRLTSAFVEAVEDARLTNEAARRHVLAGLAPLVHTISQAIAPALAQAGLAAEVARRVGEAVSASPGAQPLVRCAPEMVSGLQGVLAGRGVSALVEASPDLLPREVHIHWDEGFDRIDLDACARDILDMIANHLPHKENNEAEHDNS